MNLLDDHYVADGVADKIISKISDTTDCNKKDISLNHFKYDQFHIGCALFGAYWWRKCCGGGFGPRLC